MRKLALFSAAFMLALGLSAYLLSEAWLLWAALGAVALGAAGALLLRDKARLRALLLVAGLCLGFFYHWGYDLLFCAPARALAGQTLELELTALDYAHPTDWGCRVEAEGQGAKIRLYLDEDLDIRPGDRLTLKAELRPADQIGGEEIDYYQSIGIDLLAYQQDALELDRPERLPFRFWFKALGRTMSDRVAEIFPEDTAPFVQALTLGDKRELEKDTSLYAAMDRSGIRHVIAISGMHLSFLVSMVRQLCGRRRRTAFICIPLILFYMALVGFPVSVVRAGIMQILLLAAPLFRRESDPLTSLAFAGLVILLSNPWAICSASFQLSFGAVAGISLFSGKLYKGMLKRWRGKGKLGQKLFGFLCASLSSTLGAMAFTVPLIALHFGSVSLISPLVNLLSLWAVSLGFVLSLAACLLSFLFLPLGRVLAWCAAWPVRYVIWVAGFLARLPFAALYTMDRYVVFFLCFLYVLLGLMLIFRKGKGNPVLPLCCGLLGLGMTLLMANLRLTGVDMSLTALDVGQGQSIVLNSGGYTAVIDCGGQAAGDRAADFLAGIGERRIDALILTHWHDDHANGVAQLLERVEVARIFVPLGTDDADGNAAALTALAAEKAELFQVAELTTLTLGKMEMKIYPPIGSRSENEAGLSILCSVGDYDALVTGDMEAGTERRLLERYALPDIELLVAGHHGSKFASCQELLETVRPEQVLISVGHNSYGHPAPETLTRFSAIGAKVYRTDENGNCTVRVNNG